MLYLLLFACTGEPDPVTHHPPGPQTDDSGDPDVASWRILVYLVGDNDLETYVTHDLNELEAGHPGDEVRAIVLADRSEDYATNDGDWNNTRLYEIASDDTQRVQSRVLEDWGERDMADPATLAEFLARADEIAPADHTALVLWDHGSGWYANVPPPGIGWDDTSESDLSIAEGELDAGLRAYTEAKGPFDIIAFDACNMAFFEVGHALREHGRYLVAAQTTVGSEGLQYTPAMLALGEDPAMEAEDLARRMANDPVEISGEWTFSSVDLSQMDALAAAIDAVAVLVLDDPGAWAAFEDARAAARGSEPGEMWRLGYMDLGDLAAQLAASEHVNLATAGQQLVEAMAASSTAFGSEGFSWTSGLNIHADTWDRDIYSEGAGATWSQATHWDDVLNKLWREENAP